MARAPRKRRDDSRALVAAVKVLDARVRRCERALGFAKRKVGFQTDAVGERLEQDEDDPIPPDECRRASAVRRQGRN